MKFFLIKLKNSPRPSTKIRNKKNTSLRALHKWLMFMNLFKFYTNRQWLSQFPQFMEPTGMNVLNYRVCFNICKRYTFGIPVRLTTYSLSLMSLRCVLELIQKAYFPKFSEAPRPTPDPNRNLYFPRRNFSFSTDMPITSYLKQR